MSDLVPLLPFVLVGNLVLMAGLYCVGLRTRNMGIVDAGWTAGVGLSALCLIAVIPGWTPRRFLVGVVVGIWAARLLWLILFRRVIGQPEDGRYLALREHWGDRAPLHFLWFFAAQAPLAMLFAIPPAVAALAPAPRWQPTDLLLLSIAVAALLGEAIADRQLDRFRRDPSNRGLACRRGLWRVSRHPNYFFEWLHWWAYAGPALWVPGGWLVLLAPFLMLVFLWKITGIPHTERQALKSRPEDYRRYQRETSCFFPWFPKREASS